MEYQRIPFVWDYKRFKYIFENKTDGVNNPNMRSLDKAIDVSIYYFFNEYIEENGMDRLVLTVLASLYGIQHGQLYNDPDNDVEECIKEFETGKYDDLFTADAIALFREDVETVKKFISTNSM